MLQTEPLAAAGSTALGTSAGGATNWNRRVTSPRRIFPFDWSVSGTAKSPPPPFLAMPWALRPAKSSSAPPDVIFPSIQSVKWR